MSALAFARRVATVGLGGGLAQGLTFLAMPVITRLYPPDAYAGWAMLLSVTLLFSSVGTLRYDLSLVLPDQDEDAANLLGLCLVAAMAVSGLAAVIVAVFGEELLGKTFSLAIGGWLWTIPLLVFATALYQAACAWCVRTREFFAYSLAQFLLPLCTVSLQVVLGWLGNLGPGGLIVGTVAGQALAGLIIAIFVAVRYGHSIRLAMNRRRLWANARRYRNYPLYMTPYTLVGTLRDRLVYLLLGNFGDQTGVGYYGLSARLVNTPNSFVASAVRPVFFQMAARSGFTGMEAPLNRVLMALVVAITPAWAFFLLRAGDIVALVCGESWRGAGAYAAVLSVPAIPLLLGNWLDRGFDILGRQRLAFSLEVFFSGLSLLALSAGVFLLHDLFWAIVFQSAVLTGYYWCWLFALFRVAGFQASALWLLIALFVLLAIVGGLVASLLCAVFHFWVALSIHAALAGGAAWVFVQGRLRQHRREGA